MAPRLAAANRRVFRWICLAAQSQVETRFGALDAEHDINIGALMALEICKWNEIAPITYSVILYIHIYTYITIHPFITVCWAVSI